VRLANGQSDPGIRDILASTSSFAFLLTRGIAAAGKPREGVFGPRAGARGGRDGNGVRKSVLEMALHRPGDARPCAGLVSPWRRNQGSAAAGFALGLVWALGVQRAESVGAELAVRTVNELSQTPDAGLQSSSCSTCLRRPEITFSVVTTRRSTRPGLTSTRVPTALRVVYRAGIDGVLADGRGKRPRR